jgi:hypothetical protein
MGRNSGVRGAMRFSLGALALGAGLSVVPAAAASDTYPGKIKSVLKAPCAPSCTLCHRTAKGGGPMAKPFGWAIQATGNMVRDDPDRIPDALKKMEGTVCVCTFAEEPKTGKCDCDEDGVPDVDELREGSDPNVYGEGDLCRGPTYGCGARVARGSSDFDWAALLIAGAAAAALIAGARRSSRSG